jgi:hypothetical protein
MQRVVGHRVGPWVVVGRSYRLNRFAGQGLTSVERPGRRSRRVYRGEWSIPWSLRREGQWVHVGDPGSALGYLVDAYQGEGDAPAKMFLVRTPGGTRYRWVHRRVADERVNNSFAAVTPDGQWLVAGEWDTMPRLLVFPMPLSNPAAPPPDVDLPLAATIELDRPVNNVQGGTFVDARTMLLSSDDHTTDRWPDPYPLLEVTLPAPLDGTTVRATVSCLGRLPTVSHCRGDPEIEGLDYDRRSGILRVVVLPPPSCQWLATIYRLRRPGA